MSTVYTYSEARQNLASLLEKAIREGEVRVRGKDGQTFVITPEAVSGSPLDVEGVDLNLSREDIVAFIHEGRKYGQ
ncbi:MAG: type II toxin-antitoxin system Phd/YefM family antitoxin [Chloroflexi bacterium]|nr:type II toxin-antitoxin system Phd/YefM family antitoxin [Chloroflexota bacterium]MBK6710966.1 type II toxin-antitoxin system Phd/YefM family antitoxin [Chloroflexota bacterium]MBK6711488.1 type II toxin-antitoxin system Phd/YefM family antitoxin [Chloroflexota bacterium]MBK7176652.1 type II toxin-antitoxin system Phd/YefM family antitoxin [Chloroflexota bacterium]MBK8935015.1 type II toxin-antitoxin system Phd/YefM family antitoxin [Chloroflexota bacterium]